MSSARCGDLVMVERRDSHDTGWLLSVVGKGGKYRQVPVPPSLVTELASALAQADRPADVQAPENASVPILANLPDGIDSWSESALYKALKDLFTRCASSFSGADAARLRSASPHWLRHSHGSHALNGRPGHAPVPVQIVQNNLGHASIGTTSGYLQTEIEDRLSAMEGFWEKH
jgi:integrase